MVHGRPLTIKVIAAHMGARLTLIPCMPCLRFSGHIWPSSKQATVADGECVKLNRKLSIIKSPIERKDILEGLKVVLYNSFYLLFLQLVR
jgi:hypothetical protein